MGTGRSVSSSFSSTVPALPNFGSAWPVLASIDISRPSSVLSNTRFSLPSVQYASPRPLGGTPPRPAISLGSGLNVQSVAPVLGSIAAA